MKKSVLTLISFLLFTNIYAQPRSDSVGYQLQRKKINNMLAERSQKFGQYDESLKEHSGIFGLQTKKDIRRSNDILMDITKTDNDIYAQIKVLLDYRAFEQTEVQSKLDKSKDAETYNIGLMTAINKLRAENEKQKLQLAEAGKSHETVTRNFIMVIVLMLLSILLLLRSKYVSKR